MAATNLLGEGEQLGVVLHQCAVSGCLLQQLRQRHRLMPAHTVRTVHDAASCVYLTADFDSEPERLIQLGMRRQQLTNQPGDVTDNCINFSGDEPTLQVAGSRARGRVEDSPFTSTRTP